MSCATEQSLYFDALSSFNGSQGLCLKSAGPFGEGAILDADSPRPDEHNNASHYVDGPCAPAYSDTLAAQQWHWPLSSLPPFPQAHLSPLSSPSPAPQFATVLPFRMPSPSESQWAESSPIQTRSDFAELLRAFRKPVDGDGSRRLGAQGGLWPMGRPLQTPSFPSLVTAPSSSAENPTGNPVNPVQPWAADVIYPGGPLIEYGLESHKNGGPMYQADDETDLLSRDGAETHASTADIAWMNTSGVAAGPFVRSTAPPPDPEPEVAPHCTTIVNWKDILGSTPSSLVSGSTKSSSSFAADGDTESDLGPSSDPEDACSRSCDFAPWLKSWFVVHRLLQDEPRDPAAAITMCNAFEDLTIALTQVECHCYPAVTEVIGEMTILRIVLRSNTNNIITLSGLLRERFNGLNESILAAACAIRYHHCDDDADSDTGRSSATFISSHNGSVYLDI